MHNLGNVIKFEVLKQIRKPLFWLALFAIPAMMIIIIGISYIGGKMGSNQAKIAEQNVFNSIKSLTIVDETNLIKAEKLVGTNIVFARDINDALKSFKSTTDNQALIYYPKNIPKSAIKTYTKVVLNDNQSTQQLSIGIESLASTLLTNSIEQTISSQINQILSSQVPTEAIIFDQDGQPYNPTQRMIIPGVFLVVYFLILTITGNQILVSTTEEKENRVAEMILTTVEGRTLITGKIIALVTLGLIQIIALITPLLLFFVFGKSLINIPPEISKLFTGLQPEFWSVFFGITLLILGYIMTTGSTILVGSLFPTAQDASQFYAPVVMSSIIPIYFATAIFSGASSPIVTFLSYFPLSAPITLLMRNTAGNLSPSQGLTGLIIVAISSVLIMLIAVKAFRYGVFEYTKTGSLKKILNKKS